MSSKQPEYETLLYTARDRVATITLNRPDSLNTIVPPMPHEIEACVARANADPDANVIVLRGAGRAFCAGFDFADNMSAWEGGLNTDGRWDPGKDMIGTTSPFTGPIPKFMSMWRSPKPVIAQIHGWCVGGGSDMALCADLVIASEDAQIGTPYSRMWGCYLSAMWIYRLGLAKAKECALTGRPLSGKDAAECGLINRAVPFDELEDVVAKEAQALAALPLSQLAAMKLIVNLVLGLNRFVLAEGLSLGKKAGMDQYKLLEVLKNSAAYSKAMDMKGLKMIEHDFEPPEGKLAFHLKDVGLILDLAKRLNFPLVLSSLL